LLIKHARARARASSSRFIINRSIICYTQAQPGRLIFRSQSRRLALFRAPHFARDTHTHTPPQSLPHLHHHLPPPPRTCPRAVTQAPRDCNYFTFTVTFDVSCKMHARVQANGFVRTSNGSCPRGHLRPRSEETLFSRARNSPRTRRNGPVELLDVQINFLLLLYSSGSFLHLDKKSLSSLRFVVRFAATFLFESRV